MVPAPEIAVVIATRNRETRLAFALDALAGQTLAPQRFETIVVRDGPFPGQRTTPPPGLAVRFIDLDATRGPGAARNAGWRAARAPLIAFTDDDCRPQPDWLERLLEAWERRQRAAGVVLQGRTDPDPDEAPLLARLARSQEITGPSAWFQCCNLAYPRALLEAVGGFDPAFAGFGGEDTDLGLRAVETGAELVYEERARVWHAVHQRNLRESVADSLRWNTLPLVFARHPRQREVIRHRVFWKEAHEKLLLAAAGAALAPRSKLLAAAAAAPYIAYRWDKRVRPTPRRIAGFLPYLAERAIVDAAEVIGTMRGAVRARTLLL